MKERLQDLERLRVEALDSILGKPFRVLDDGFIRVIDYMGTDASIVQAARVAYGEGTKKRRQDEELIRYLMRHRHTSPFEMCEIKLHLRVPMDTWRQWIRHRTANVNEYSTRYSIAIDAAYATDPGAWRTQSASNRQGSAGFLPPETGRLLSERERELQETARSVYQERLEAGVAREQARKDLPLCTYTEAYWKIDLKNLLNFLALRMEAHAQEEIRAYATIIGEEIVSRWCPDTWKAFRDYTMESLTFSPVEQGILAALLAGDRDAAIAAAETGGWLPRREGALTFHLERYEFENKCGRLGIAPPWM
ncbi:FAD-dependent thymidylate synthase [bacterium]|nr:FAD-dependent thymidylate synthase [bacterium]